MVQYCCVPKCKNSALTKNISMHQIPLDENLRNKWIVKIRRDDSRSTAISKHMRVCSAHFKATDYFQNPSSKCKKLIKGAVPSVFSFAPEKRERKKPFLRAVPVVDEESTCSITYPYEPFDSSSSTDDASESENIDDMEDLRRHLAELQKEKMDRLAQINSLQPEVDCSKNTIHYPTACRNIKVEPSSPSTSTFPDDDTEESVVPSCNEYQPKKSRKSERKRRFENDELVKQGKGATDLDKSLCISEDRHDILGKYIASQMRFITDETLYLETKIALEGIVNDAFQRMINRK